MSRTAPSTRPFEAKVPATATRPQPAKRPGEFRETCESVVVAIILALLVRAYAVEAFVIPTGSMAPTLMGRHKDVACPQCGQYYPVNAHKEVDPPYIGRGVGPGYPRIQTGVCSNCQFPAKLAAEPSYKGDRILVMKFPYLLPDLPGSGGPSRWDVVVFAYPEIPEQNYIKRLAGLPGEVLRVSNGDILTRPRGAAAEPFRVARKPSAHQAAMQVLVYDDAHRPEALKGKEEWLRWVPGPASAWREGEPGTFGTPVANGWQVLRYRHLVPDSLQWAALSRGVEPATRPRATLITDFNSYNSDSIEARRGERDTSDPHWVGDLTMECRLETSGGRGQVRLELVRGGTAARCDIDVETGMAQFSNGPNRLGKPVACGVKGPGSHDLAFANVDGRLNLWVDGATPFGDGVAYDDHLGQRPLPTSLDLSPANLAVNGLGAQVTRLVLKRDIYYTLSPGQADYGRLSDAVERGVARQKIDPQAAEAFLEAYHDFEHRPGAIFDFLANPALFPALAVSASRDFDIRPDHYMMMGDNSPHSKDGRAWTSDDQLDVHPSTGWDPDVRATHEVPASLLVGKAFFIYWPHGVPFWPKIRLWEDFYVPFRPYFERMKAIR